MLEALQVADMGARWIRDRRPRLEHPHGTAGLGEPARNDSADGSAADDYNLLMHRVVLPRVSLQVHVRIGDELSVLS